MAYRSIDAIQCHGRGDGICSHQWTYLQNCLRGSGKASYGEGVGCESLCTAFLPAHVPVTVGARSLSGELLGTPHSGSGGTLPVWVEVALGTASSRSGQVLMQKMRANQPWSRLTKMEASGWGWVGKE